MAIFYGDFSIAGTGGNGAWATPFKLGDMQTAATMSAVHGDDELRIVGYADAALFTALAGTVSALVNTGYLTTSNDLTAVLAALDIVYVPTMTEQKFFPVQARTTTQIQFDSVYYNRKCWETLATQNAWKVTALGNTGSAVNYLQYCSGTAGHPVLISFGWDTDSTQAGKTLITNKGTGAVQFFNNCAYCSIDGRYLYVMAAGNIYFGPTSNGSVTLNMTQPIAAVYQYANQYKVFGGCYPNRFTELFVGYVYQNNYNSTNGAVDLMSVGNYMTYFYSSYTSNIVVLDIGAASGVNNYIGTWDVSYWRNYYSGGANFNGSAQSYIRDMKMGGSGTIWNFYGVEHGKTTKVEVGNLGNIGGSAWTFTVTAQWLASVMFTRTGGATTAANISIVINICGGARYINSDFGTGFTTFGAAQTCTYSVSSYYPRADFLNCKLPVNQAANWWVAGQSGAGPAGMSKSLYIPYVTLQNCTDAAGGAIPDTVALGTYYAAIMLDMYKEPTTFKTVAPSLGFKGTGANNWHRYGPIKIKGKATKLTTVSFQCRKNASYGSSNLPYVELHYFDASGLQMNVATMTDTNDTWVPLSVAGTPVYDRDLDLYLWVYGCNTVAMRCYIDDIAVTVAT